MTTPHSLTSAQLQGVHHTARPTWKLKETVHFYRDLLGLELVHAISAKGWGPDDHADFLHFFFDSGKGSTIAFFYYLGTERPDWLAVRNHYQYRATHTAWLVDSEAELLKWRQRVEEAGIPLRYQIRHEIIESIYFNDPNGYPIEITWQVRPFSQADIQDAKYTLESAIELEEQGLKTIDQVWQQKANKIHSPSADKANIYVLDVPEFSALVDIAKENPDYTVHSAEGNYIRIEGSPQLTFKRKELGFKLPVWYSAFTGGVQGKITTFDADQIVIEPGVIA